MQAKECIAMILAGGKGTRLGALTNHMAKPVVNYGGKYRIIDFTLSNCVHSGIDTLGVLTQYEPLVLHDYIRDGKTWDLNSIEGGVYMLPSQGEKGDYIGTADAVFQNIEFIEKFNPEHVLILSGDHVYKMDYGKMLLYHKRSDADITISVKQIPINEAHRFGIISTDRHGRITEFVEKPNTPKGNLASMGIYIFKWSVLKSFLINDQYNIKSEHDFGKNIIPAALSADKNMYAYKFKGYWRDVGTVQSLWESNMDLINEVPPINLYDDYWKILTKAQCCAPCYLSAKAEVKHSIITEGCHIYGKLSNSIIFESVTIGDGAEIIDSILMPNAVIGKGAKIYKSIIGSYATIGANAEIGVDDGINTFVDSEICSNDISLIGPGVYIEMNTKLKKNSHISEVILKEHTSLVTCMKNKKIEFTYA